MKKNSKNMANYLSRSVLLKESSSPALSRGILIFTILIIAAFVYLATRVELNQTISSYGVVLTKDDVVEIQHFQGGIISELNVKEGDLVEKGDVLIRFSDDLISNKINEEYARIATLNKEIELLKEDLDIKSGLLEQKLISRSSFLSLERSYNDSVGERTLAYYSVANYKYLKENLLVISPIKGYVYSLKTLSIGTIIKPSETFFEVIPYNRDYMAELRISVIDRGKVSVGQDVMLKFTSYDYTKYGGMTGKLKDISVTTYSDNYGNPYFKAFVDLEKDYVGEDQDKLNILSGMTLSADINIGTKSLFEYLVIPVRAVGDNSFNEP